MYLSKKSNFFNYLYLLVVISSMIAYFLYKIQPDFGLIWDTADFLILALDFTGKGIGYVDLIRPPVLPFLTSIIFRLGYVSENVIFALDGILFIFGVIGLYLLLNLRFNPLRSFIACILYSTFPIMLFYVSIGLSDIPSVSFSIWAIYFTILAVKKNNKFFYLAFPFAIISFLTRYPMALIIYPLFFYIFINRNNLENKKDLILGILLSFVLIIPFISWSFLKFGNPLYPFIPSFSVTVGVSSEELFYYNPDIFYFTKILPRLLGNVSIAITIITIFGLFIYNIRSKFWLKLNFKRFYNYIYSKSNNYKIRFLILILLILFFIISFGNIFYMFSEVIFLVISILFYELLKNSKYPNLNMDLLIISWFMSFFIFHSVYVIKDQRYLITMAPAVSYFLILGLNELSNKFKLVFKNKNITFSIISVFIVIGLLVSTTNTLIDLNEISAQETVTDDIILASNWFKNYDPDYKTKIIYSDYYPHSTWYLRTDINKMPILKDNKEIYARLKELNLSNEDFKVYEKELSQNNADYYFCINAKINLTSYKVIKRFGDVYIYEKI